MTQAFKNSCPIIKAKVHPKNRISPTLTALERLINKKQKTKTVKNNQLQKEIKTEYRKKVKNPSQK